MELTSPAFEGDSSMPADFTCDGQNINPPLDILDVPRDASSLVLIVEDPDAVGGTWTHWTVWNIDPSTTMIPENSVPEGAVEGETSFGQSGYGGPCPPEGTHRYYFKIYALDTNIDLTPETSRDLLDQTIEGHVIEKAEIIGLYSRG